MISEGEESKRQTQIETHRLDTDTRILRAHVYTRSRSHTIKDTLTPHKHRRRMTAASELGKHEKRVVVQHCWLTCDRKAAPRPPAPGHPRRSQYWWTLKMGASRIRLEERRRTCDAEHDGTLCTTSRIFGGLC